MSFDWKNKNVLITGHTGFKGSWLSLWLSHLGAKVHGIALDPPSQPNLFTLANVKSIITADHRLDIRDSELLKTLIVNIQPEIIFHLAAQPLVRYSYQDPVLTYTTNIIGTMNLLEAIRATTSVSAAVIVTTDKCYLNMEKKYSFVENDQLGGFDPYSSSKACAELVTAAYRASYFNREDNVVNIATARAGNVIGGGDWAENRLIPDYIKAYTAKQKLQIRYPTAIRPWQHVLESICGYITLGEKLLSNLGNQFAGAWNFGPDKQDMVTVKDVINKIMLRLPLEIEYQNSNTNSLAKESEILMLDSSKSKNLLNWSPKWNLETSIEHTLNWYLTWIKNQSLLKFSLQQIENYHTESVFGK